MEVTCCGRASDTLDGLGLSVRIFSRKYYKLVAINKLCVDLGTQGLCGWLGVLWSLAVPFSSSSSPLYPLRSGGGTETERET